MSRPDFDVAIVGAGPGGGMAACILAGSGLRVALIERQRLPRPKACGGAMPSSAREMIGWDISALVEAEVSEQLFRFGDGRREVVAKPDTPMLLVDRAAFDNHFVERAKSIASGSLTVVEDASVVGAREDADGVVLTGRGGLEVRASYVIAADGATSAVARALGLYRPAAGAAIDAEVTVTDTAFERERHRSTFDLGCVRGGYGWVFPKRRTLACGVGIWASPAGLKPAVRRLLADRFARGEIVAVEERAHPVPVFPGHGTRASRRVCLVGDAAHLVDPVVGEGIVYALQSGRLAADVVGLLCGVTPRAEAGADRRYAEGLAGIVTEHGDCGAYQWALRHTLARQLNLKRIRSAGFFGERERPYSGVAAG